MKKNESKYFNTVRLMNQALLLLLEKKEFEFITIKEICQKAGVNRSTFYLHYENIMDLFDETVCFLNDDFVSAQKVDEKYSAIRFCTSWATKTEAVEELLKDLKEYI